MANYNLFDAASLAMVPTGIKDGKLYSVKPDDGSGDFTFSRGTNLAATRVNADGLIEKGRENLLLQSNNFSSGSWLSVNAAITEGQTGYDGLSNAWLLSANADFCNLYQEITETGLVTFSVYAKAGTGNWLMMRLNGSANNLIYVDLANKVFGNLSPQYIDGTITDLGGGWRRVSVTINQTSYNNAHIYVAESNGSISTTNETIYIQDAQLERGLVATDYIETTTAPVQAGITEDLPRIDYTDGCGSLLLEPSRTNGVLQSEHFGSGWLLSNTTITSNDTTSPEGVINAAKIVENSSTANHYIAEDVATTSGVAYTMSFFAKKGENRYIRASRAGGSVAVGFDLENGDFVEGGGAIGDTQDFGNGWYRCIMTFNTNTTTTQIRIELSNALSATNTTYLGDGTSGVYAYGAQLEAGSYPTSYIPTYGTSTSRVNDRALLSGANAVAIIDKPAMTLYAEYVHDTANTNTTILSILRNTSGGSYGDFISLVMRSDGEFQIEVKSNNTLQALRKSSAVSSGTHKIAAVVAKNNVKLFVDGVLAGSDTSVTLPTGLNEIYLGGYPDTNVRYGTKKSYFYFPTALTDNELAALTRPYDTYQEWVDGEGLTWESKSCTVQNLVELQNL